MEKSRDSGAVVDAVGSPDPVEDVVVTALRAVLGVNEVAPGTQFAALGGDSLRAVRVLSRLWRELGVELPVDSLQTGTTVAEFVAVVREHARAEHA
jgi:acyl carrier protein